ncbi:MAG: tetratricopeptide repeat protein [Gemmatimonadaceae bacterium]|nr:tetratricopeptide repeat protein [Gemmatimonadaceae bacterium]
MTSPLVQHLTAGLAALEQGAYAEAIRAFSAARAQAPHDAALALALANAQRLGGRVPDARATLTGFVQSDAEVSVAECYELGAALLEAGAPQEAIECLEAVRAQRPQDPAVMNVLAGARRAAGQPAAAWPLCEAALARDATTAAFRLTAAQVRHELGDLAGALHWLDEAERLRPNHSPTQLQRAYTLLLKGGGADASGWAAFESRSLPEPATAAKAWHGEPLAGCSILVTAEQGVGDQFQFVRFVARLAEQGPSRVVVQCHRDAVTLLQANGLEAIARDASPPETDWHVPMLSLPHRLGLGTAVDGARVPYLRAPGAPLPPRRASRRLGLVWAGNPAFVGRATRDLDAALLPQLGEIADVEWIGLQVGSARASAPDFVSFVSESYSWLDSASVLASLDGLVTTDTGIAHLAGAMGVRTWVLLQHIPDWRWGTAGATSSWYPSMTLIRPDGWNDWASVLRHLRTALAAP